MRLDRALACAALLVASLAHAQLVPMDPDWHEVEAPPPGAFGIDDLVPLDIPGSTLRFGVAPASVAIGSDGIVRFIVVARGSGGAVNALYEGIRCATGEYKVYARHNPGSGWVIARDAQWQPLQDAPLFRHALFIARNGACVGHGTSDSAGRILRDLRSPTGRYDLPQ